MGLWQKRFHSWVATVSLFIVVVLAHTSNWSRDRVLLPSMHTLWGRIGGAEASAPAQLEAQCVPILQSLGLKGHVLGRDVRAMCGGIPRLLTETQEGQKLT